jgi:hypothetical protein
MALPTTKAEADCWMLSDVVWSTMRRLANTSEFEAATIDGKFALRWQTDIVHGKQSITVNNNTIVPHVQTYSHSHTLAYLASPSFRSHENRPIGFHANGKFKRIDADDSSLQHPCEMEHPSSPQLATARVVAESFCSLLPATRPRILCWALSNL